MSEPQHRVDVDRSYDLLDAIPSPVYVWRRTQDGAIRLVFANRGAYAETRGRIEELLGGAVDELYADAPRVCGMIVDTLGDGVRRQMEHEYRLRSTGELRWFRTSYMRHGDDEVVILNEDLTERRAAEALLEASEARFRAVFEQGLTAMSLTRFDGSFIQVNAAFCEMLGYTEEQLLARTFVTLTHPDDVAADVERKARLVRGEVPSFRMEKRFVHADGRTVYADLSARLMRDAKGTPLYLLSQMQDITARKQGEAAQRRERARMAQLLDRAPAIICTLRAPDHVYEMANEECRRFLGRDDMIGRPLAEIMPEIAEQGLSAILGDVLATGQPFVAHAMPVPVRPAPDAPPVERFLNVVVQPIEDLDGTRTRTFAHCVDVTELVTAAREQERLTTALRASQERHDLVLMATNELIYDWDVAGGTVFYSDALYTAFCHDHTAVGESYEWWVEQIHPDDRLATTSSLAAAIERNETRWVSEYRFRRGDGSYANVMDRAHLILDADRKPARLIGSMVDVSERRRLEAQLRESQKMEAVGRLAGGVAHDFNNLLSAILGYADLALLDADETSPVRDEIEEIRKAAQRAAQLTRQLLAVGRRQIRRPTRVEIDAAVRESDRLLTQLLGERIKLTVRAGAGSAAVHMDPGEIDQILVNLAVNARDAMPEGGSVTIETTCCVALPGGAAEAPREHVLLAMTDTGGGIDAETMPHIFEPFFTTKGESGTGLGLSTVYGIVEQAGGRIEVDTTVGTGTRFRIYLPVATNDEPEPDRAPPVAMPPLSAQPATVLLAEDESGVRTLAQKILERAGFRVLAAVHGVDALGVWERHADEIDVVVTDVVMPEMGGRALADALRARRPELPILFMSGYSDDETTRRGLADLRIAFLAKPFTAESLVNAVRAVVRAGAR